MPARLRNDHLADITKDEMTDILLGRLRVFVKKYMAREKGEANLAFDKQAFLSQLNMLAVFPRLEEHEATDLFEELLRYGKIQRKPNAPYWFRVVE